MNNFNNNPPQNFSNNNTLFKSLMIQNKMNNINNSFPLRIIMISQLLITLKIMKIVIIILIIIIT